MITLLLYVLWPSKHDRENGVSLRTFWAETKDAFKSYINKNRTSRKKRAFDCLRQQVLFLRAEKPGLTHILKLGYT